MIGFDQVRTQWSLAGVMTKGNVNGSRKISMSELVFQIRRKMKVQNGNLLDEVVAEIRICRSPVA